MDSFNQDYVEKRIADYILDKVSTEEMPPERAAQIARFVLAHIPESMSLEELVEVIPTFDNDFIELTQLVSELLDNYYESKKATVANQVTELIKSDELDSAHQVVKDFLDKKL